ncbi:hypothetical protein Tcan_03974 [Toxocara canis]|uniref:Uncharacterized protein n=1 Tax=Toxocara canis TaxID=6265 RepID=A0A0B2VLN1_TOXCA|nr:hypothetical protein Tcan_03974 [Toxocara canis]
MSTSLPINKLLYFAILIFCTAATSVVQQKADEIFNETNTLTLHSQHHSNEQTLTANSWQTAQQLSTVITSNSSSHQAVNLTMKGGQTIIVHLSGSGNNTITKNGTSVEVTSRGGWSSSKSA